MKKVLTLLLSLAAVAPIQAQSTPYYITDGDANRAYIVQNGVLQSTFTLFDQKPFIPSYALRFNQGNLLVAARDGSSSQEYTAAGVPTGVINNLGSQLLDQLLDGGTDGTSTYVSRCCAPSGNGIYKGDINFGNLTMIVDGEAFGVTYGAGFVWALMDVGGLGQFTTTGQLVNRFALPYQNTAALAFEVSTNSLWLGINGTGDIYNLSLTGQELAHLTIAGLEVNNFYGGEMLNRSTSTSVVPEPSTYVLMGVGLLAVGAATRRRRPN